MNPFEFLKSINSSKKDIMVDDDAEKGYNPFIVNRGLSQFLDTILFANEMNRYHHLDNKLQFHYLINSIRKGKRFSKWAKADSLDNIEVVKEYFGYGSERAREALRLLSDEQLIELKNKVDKGGTRRSKTN
jgi:hypothetical protein